MYYFGLVSLILFIFKMKIVAISDTHGRHADIVLPKGDLLIHAGDVSSRGTRAQVTDFIDWYARQPHKHKIFIAGNHDFFFEKADVQEIKELIPEGISYLNDSGVEIEGVKFWGSPVTPWFYNWAFNRDRGAEIKQHWDLIPEDTQVLITHGPPSKILDKTVRGELTGCEELLSTVLRINPRYHIFGHIHEGQGSYTHKETSFFNVSVLDHHYKVQHPPTIIEI